MMTIKQLLRTLSAVIAGMILSMSLSNHVLAQTTSFDDIPLNGLASFEQLRQEYYIGALYLESLSQESGMVFNFSGRKRMDIRITIDKWPPRRFASQWNQAILINNEQAVLEQFAKEILAFTELPKEDLVVGDRLTIDMDPNAGTLIYLNGNLAMQVKDNAFFDILLNVWIGQRPPSSVFKNDILALNTDANGTELLIRYQATIPTDERTNTVAKWYNLSPKKPVAPTPQPAQQAAVSPPDSETTVTARRSGSADKEKVKVDIDLDSTGIASPKVEVKKPVLAAAIEKPAAPAPQTPAAPAAQKPVEAVKVPAPAPAAKPVPAAAEKPAPAKAADTAVATAPKEQPKQQDDEQDRLLKVYQSNILKLTYLNTQYPKRAMDLKQEGLVVLKVIINREGKLVDVVTEQSSEHRLLDKAARNAVNKTAPFPEAPNTLEGKEFEINMPFNFKL